MRRPSPRRLMWVSGIAWLVSWSCLGLEICYLPLQVRGTCIGAPNSRHHSGGISAESWASMCRAGNGPAARADAKGSSAWGRWEEDADVGMSSRVMGKLGESG
jgi:hypothetical protein